MNIEASRLDGSISSTISVALCGLTVKLLTSLPVVPLGSSSWLSQEKGIQERHLLDSDNKEVLSTSAFICYCKNANKNVHMEARYTLAISTA